MSQRLDIEHRSGHLAAAVNGGPGTPRLGPAVHSGIHCPDDWTGLLAQERPSHDQAEPVAAWTDWPAVVLVSHRGPAEHYVEDGHVVARRGSGGLITALDGLARRTRGTWIAAAMTAGDCLVAGHDRPAPMSGYAMSTRLVEIDPVVAQRHYHRIANPLLWFLQHDLASILQAPPTDAAVAKDWQDGYVAANRALAQAAVEEARAFILAGGAPPIVAVHDYQLYLVPRFVRAALPAAPIHFFLHIPWPAPSSWRLLPTPILRSICEGLLACDVVGFQTPVSAGRFAETCLDVVPGASATDGGLISWRGRTTRVASYPISVDVDLLRRQVADQACRRYQDQLATGWTGQTIVRVDRVDPTKNLLAGFAAYDRLLRRRPDLRGQVRLLAFLVPSRSAIPEYRTYADAVLATIETINADHGNADWRPIQAFFENNHPQALAGMAIADVLFVNPLADGMNLVAKEGVVVNQRGAVLVLSHTAGAYAELGPAAVGVPPSDVDATATALERALAMPWAERRERAAWLGAYVERNDIHQWLMRRYADLARAHAGSSRFWRRRAGPSDPSSLRLDLSLDRPALVARP